MPVSWALAAVAQKAKAQAPTRNQHFAAEKAAAAGNEGVARYVAISKGGLQAFKRGLH
jgi:hypothetical protein